MLGQGQGRVEVSASMSVYVMVCMREDLMVIYMKEVTGVDGALVVVESWYGVVDDVWRWRRCWELGNYVQK